MPSLHHVSMRSRGFTLVEMAIVLVIIGLLAGAVLAGSTLIRTAEIQVIIKERQTLEAAINTFRIRYHSLPGDIPNATAYWGAADPVPATCATTYSGDLRTCNGNGNKQIWGNFSLDPLEFYEALRVWQHLANAGFISGAYTGVPGAGAGGMNFVIGENAPKTKLEESSWTVQYLAAISAARIAASGGTLDHMFPGNYSQALIFGTMKDHPALGTAPFGPVINAGEVFEVDLKLDDGRPATGELKTWAPISNGGPYDNACATSTDPATARYDAFTNDAKCVLIFKMEL